MHSRLALIAVLLLTLFFLLPPAAFAEDLESKAAKPLFSLKTDDREPLFGDRFTLKVGYKVWVAKWQAQANASATAQSQVNADHPAFMNGPSLTGILKLRDSQWFNAAVFNFTWLRDGFDFAEQQPTSGHFFANRRDYTVTAGLTIFEGFGIFAGYYNSRQEFTNQPNTGPLASRHPRMLSGPVFGVFGSVPVTERFSFYGNLAYAPLDFKGQCALVTNCAKTKSVQGWMNEVGVTLAGPSLNLEKIGVKAGIGTELQLGFRAQLVQKNFGNNATGSGSSTSTDQLPLQDITYGPIFMINAVF